MPQTVATQLVHRSVDALCSTGEMCTRRRTHAYTYALSRALPFSLFRSAVLCPGHTACAAGAAPATPSGTA